LGACLGGEPRFANASLAGNQGCGTSPTTSALKQLAKRAELGCTTNQLRAE
jgi:hypothetical protein